MARIVLPHQLDTADLCILVQILVCTGERHDTFMVPRGKKSADAVWLGIGC